jgi:hypothetical protein
MKALPRFSELPELENTGERHAWNAFGAGDELGTVNLLGADQVLQASRLVRRGKVINLSLPLNYPITLYDMPARAGYKHHIEVSRAGRDDYVDNFAMQGSTQWDSLRHIRYREFGYYGGSRTTTSIGMDDSASSIGHGTGSSAAASCSMSSST